MRLLRPELLRPDDEAFVPVSAEHSDMLLSAVVVGLVVALMVVLIVRSLMLRAVGRPAAPKRARKKAPAPRNLHLVVNKNDMDRELAALLGKERARPPDSDAH